MENGKAGTDGAGRERRGGGPSDGPAGGPRGARRITGAAGTELGVALGNARVGRSAEVDRGTDGSYEDQCQ